MASIFRGKNIIDLKYLTQEFGLNPKYSKIMAGLVVFQLFKWSLHWKSSIALQQILSVYINKDGNIPGNHRK